MSRIALPMLMVGLSLVPVLCWAAEPNADQAKTIAAIEKLGGKVAVDEDSPGRPVIGVDFGQIANDLHRTRITDAGLEHLEGLTLGKGQGSGSTRAETCRERPPRRSDRWGRGKVAVQPGARRGTKPNDIAAMLPYPLRGKADRHTPPTTNGGGAVPSLPRTNRIMEIHHRKADVRRRPAEVIAQPSAARNKMPEPKIAGRKSLKVQLETGEYWWCAVANRSPSHSAMDRMKAVHFRPSRSSLTSRS